MPYTQTSRALSVSTPLGKDTLLLAGFTGQEALSQLFSFQLDLMAENKTEIAFDKLLGQKVTIHLALPADKQRHFSGICNRISQGLRDETFTRYQCEIVPQFWLLTKRAQSRVFQHMAVPDILKKVLEGLDVKYELQGSYQPRDFCVQYRETDFNFASRLMEEEGIYYFFTHSTSGHQMIVANTTQSHPDVPESCRITFEELVTGTREDNRVQHWEKVQELRSGKYTLWDHCFELPHKHLEADMTVMDSVQVGKVSHRLKVGDNDKLEIFDYPGEYAQRFDGVDRGGGERAGDLQKIFDDNKRTAQLRMQQEESQCLLIRGAGNCGQFMAGHKFTLERHFNADGAYVLTSVAHSARGSADYRSDSDGGLVYQNSFTCVPLALPFRPVRLTPRPVVPGTQTAVVVGPSGEEIFTDKYGRVKVQFHWDRQGRNDAGSSCWVRVASVWAGKQWGGIHIPRIGQEVIVDFIEGDPDQPIVVGSVYNADQMPPYKLPDNKTQSGIKTRSTLDGTHENFNEIRFEDKKGQEQLFVHAERNQDIEVEKDETHWVGHDRKKKVDNDEDTTIGRDRKENVGKNETISIGENRTESVGKNEDISIGKNRTENVGDDESITIGKNRAEQVGKSEEVSVGENRTHSVGKNDQLDVGKEMRVTAGDIITFTTGSASLILKKNGDIQLKGSNITVDGSGKVNVKAAGDVALKGSKVTQN